MKTIKFYKVNEQYGFFSNLSPYPIYIDGAIWATVEHYFQANKLKDNIVKDKIKPLSPSIEVAIAGRDKKNEIRNDWKTVQEQVMKKALLAKFLQHPKIRQELLLTENSIIVEHNANDSYWGDGGDGSGKNMLGILLMEVREEIKKYSKEPILVLPPWIAFPTISQYDMFWRMGLGEEYLTQWLKYYLNTNRIKYREEFPEAKEWEGTYE